jgi:hypothetical protein
MDCGARKRRPQDMRHTLQVDLFLKTESGMAVRVAHPRGQFAAVATQLSFLDIGKERTPKNRTAF